jgi:hypothetical protein
MMRSRFAGAVLVIAMLATLGGCAAATPGDRAATSTDHSWIKVPGLFDRFDTAAGDFSPLNAYLLALAVRAGDMNTSAQRDTLKAWGFERVSPVIDREASVYAYVASNPRMVLAVFSGTDIRNIRDLESDADAIYPVRRERYSRAADAVVHRGFAAGMDVVWDSISDEIKSHAKGDGEHASPKPVWIAGHSRGGAFAMLAASGWAQDKTVNIAGLYTYGQPRVGNIAFARGFNSYGIPYFRVINERDAVAGVPTRIGDFGADYSHAGTVAHLAPGPLLRKDPPPASMRLFVIDPDHYMDEYLKTLYTVVTEPKRIEAPHWARAAAPATGPMTAGSELPKPPG